jgi:putative hydrolase of the HAD superfamily
MGKIQVIFFDAAGTLFEVRGSVGRIYSAIASSYGVETDPDALDLAFATAFRAKSEQGFSCMKGDRTTEEKRWWFEVVSEVFGNSMPPEAFLNYFDEVFEYFRTAEAWRLFPDTRPALENLRAIGYRLGIISNFDSRLTDLLVNLGIGHLFERMILSWHAGIAKPDPGIFMKGTEAMGVEPGDALHVGDSLEDDYWGASRANLRAVLFDSKGKYSHRTDLPRITKLSDLCLLLRANRV